MAKRRRTFTVTTDGTKAGTSVVDEETGRPAERVTFTVRGASGGEILPGESECLMMMAVGLEKEPAREGEVPNRRRFGVLPGGLR